MIGLLFFLPGDSKGGGSMFTLVAFLPLVDRALVGDAVGFLLDRPDGVLAMVEYS